ncbi:MAG TPA: 5-dehydro-4-deoxyglucarate dehydratase [Bryobacteraceae bacterium]|nr:5-dehydro-4-deoxyglucarate dehydratase [Bryobacteraceae bacterium]
MALRDRIRGVLGFPVTPFRQDLSLDLDGLARNVDEMSRHPFCALVAAGGTGELYSLTPEEVEQVVRTTVQAAAGRMPVVAGAGYSAAIAADMARRAEKAGADCVLLLPPYYSNAPFEGLIDYYAAAGSATGLPLMVYSRDWAVFTPAMVVRLAERVPTLEFWKDGQGDVRKYQRIIQSVGDRLAWLGGLGDDCVPGYFAVGVQAYTSSISNIAPLLSVQLSEAGQARDFARLDALMARYVHPLYAIRERSKGYEVSVMKAAMEILGMPAGPVRPPLTNCTERDLADIRKLMEAYADVLDAHRTAEVAR